MLSRIVHFLEKVVRIFSRELSALLVLILVIMVMAETISRYFFNSPLMIADEFGAYFLVAIVILGAGDTWSVKGHINIDTFRKMLPDNIQRWIKVFTLLLALIFTPVLIYTSYQLVLFSGKIGMRSESWLRTPLVWPQLFLLLGFSLLFIQIFCDVIKLFKTPKQNKREIK